MSCFINGVPFVGLTGGIGSGKTFVANIFQQLFSIPVIDTDVIAFQISQTAFFSREVIRIFGKGILDPLSKVDRKKLRSAVFSSHEKRLEYEQFIHPLILKSAKEQISKVSEAYGILVVPLLFEKQNFRVLVDRSLLVDCPDIMQIERVKTRSGLSEEEIAAVMVTQMSRDERLIRADDIVENIYGRQKLSREVVRLHQFYLHKFH